MGFNSGFKGLNLFAIFVYVWNIQYSIPAYSSWKNFVLILVDPSDAKRCLRYQRGSNFCCD